MKEYTSLSSHEIGYKWYITAPDGLDDSEIEILQHYLIDYTDIPSTEEMLLMLDDWDNFIELDKAKEKLFRQVEIEIKIDYRENFAHDFERI